LSAAFDLAACDASPVLPALGLELEARPGLTLLLPFLALIANVSEGSTGPVACGLDS
jgi:hypothetical protein